MRTRRWQSVQIFVSSSGVLGLSHDRPQGTIPGLLAPAHICEVLPPESLLQHVCPPEQSNCPSDVPVHDAEDTQLPPCWAHVPLPCEEKQQAFPPGHAVPPVVSSFVCCAAQFALAAHVPDWTVPFESFPEQEAPLDGALQHVCPGQLPAVSTPFVQDASSFTHMPLAHVDEAWQQKLEAPAQLLEASIDPAQALADLQFAGAHSPAVAFGTQQFLKRVFASQLVPLLAVASYRTRSVQNPPEVHDPPIPSQLTEAAEATDANMTKIKNTVAPHAHEDQYLRSLINIR